MKKLKVNPEKKMVELVEAGRKSVASLKLGDDVKFVGWQLHYVSGEVLSSVGGYTNGFKMEDYEG